MITPNPATQVPTEASAPGAFARLRDRFGRLPRDARDTLFLLAVIGWTLLPHLSHLPAWASALSFGLLGWRARAAWRGGALPPRWVPVLLLVITIALTLVQFRTLLGKEAGVTLVALLVSMKTLELRARRDAFVVFFLGFFLVLTHFLYSQSLLTALAMLVSVWGLLTALVLAHMPVGQPALGRAAGLALRTAVLGAPLMALLFVLFPRVAPLWGLPQDAGGRTGLSNTMQIGHVAELVQDESVAMRVRFPEGRMPRPEQLYFRGPVLTLYDGLEWRRLEPRFTSEQRQPLRVAGTPLSYQVTLEPSRLQLLPLLEMTAVAPTFEADDNPLVPRLGDDLQWTTRIPVMERVRFSAEAYLEHRHGPSGRSRSLQDALDLPAGRHPRLQQWAQDLRDSLFPQGSRGAEDAPALAQALMRHIRSGNYVYTLAPGEYLGDALDGFWFDRREGFCEHYAAAFVVAMRAMGVPARVVTGFQGGEFNPVDGYLQVRNADAHAWAEYWQPGIGWQRADPTAAVAPDRIIGTQRLAAPRGAVASAITGVNPELVAQMRALWSALDNTWNQWVLNYSRGQQLDLLKNLGLEAHGWEDVSYILITVICILALGGALWAWWDQRRIEPWLRAYRRTAAALIARGVDAAPHMPPRTLAQSALARHGEAARPLSEALLALERARYAPAADSKASATAAARAALRAARTLPAT